jgi:hypothetical protein
LDAGAVVFDAELVDLGFFGGFCFKTEADIDFGGILWLSVASKAFSTISRIATILRGWGC